MEKEQTVLQQLIEFLEEEIDIITDEDSREDKITRRAYKTILAKATSLLEAEKGMVAEANETGYEDAFLGNKMDGTKYFNNKYKADL